MATVVAAMSGVPFQQQVSSTTGAGTVLALPPSFRNHTWYITANAGVTSGAVQLESGTDPTLDTGTWGLITANPITVTAGVDLLVQATGIFTCIRARVSTTIAGGTTAGVTVTYVGAKSY